MRIYVYLQPELASQAVGSEFLQGYTFPDLQRPYSYCERPFKIIFSHILIACEGFACEEFLFASRSAVIPAHAGIHVFLLSKQLQRRQDVDPGMRRDDGSASSVQA
jgi:hypothetical protein